ncbi:flippase-like domain-containing protein [Candidatus Woesearchaeota archaeon]|nr:flippase-like domain-containing protein [Candidatus Woesearchaeota archaeon]
MIITGQYKKSIIKMATNKLSIKRIIIILFLLSSVFIALIYYIGPSKIISQLKELNILYFMIALAIGFIIYLIKAYRLSILSSIFCKKTLGFKEAFSINSIGILLGTSTPARLGELYKIKMISKSSHSTLAQSTACWLNERLPDVLILIVAAIFLSFFSAKISYVSFALKIFSLLFLLCIILGFLFIFTARKLVKKGFSFASKQVNKTNKLKLLGKILKLLRLLYESIYSIRNNFFGYSKILIISVIIWSLEVLLLRSLLAGFGMSLSFFVIFGIMGISIIIAIISSLPLGLGVADLSYIGLYVLYGIPSDAATAAIFLYRVIQLILIFGIGTAVIAHKAAKKL